MTEDNEYGEDMPTIRLPEPGDDDYPRTAAASDADTMVVGNKVWHFSRRPPLPDYFCFPVSPDSPWLKPSPVTTPPETQPAARSVRKRARTVLPPSTLEDTEQGS